MGLLSAFKPDPKCGACGRSYQRGSTCLRCKNIERGHKRQAASRGVDPAPRQHNCPDGKTRTMRGGICPGPYC
jgi:hypothetical protein